MFIAEGSTAVRGFRRIVSNSLAILVIAPALLLAACATEEEAPPPPPPPVVEQPPVVQPANYVVLFDFDSAALTAAGQTIVGEVTSAALADPGLNIDLVGHTDTVGSPAYNQRLSTARAESIRSALVSGGVSADRISAVGRGETDLAVPTGDGVRNQANRRVVITAM